MNDQPWNTVYSGDSSLEAYQEQFQQLAPVSWDVIETTQGDLLAMLVNRVEAATGAPIILALGRLSRAHPGGDSLPNDMLATIMEHFTPRRAKTLFASLVAGWRTSTGHAIDQAPEIIAGELARAIRRLHALDLPEHEQTALDHMRNLLYPEAGTSTEVQTKQQEQSAGTT